MAAEPTAADARSPDVNEKPADKQTYRWDAFVSHNSADHKFAKRLKAQLEDYKAPKDIVAERGDTRPNT